MREFLDGALWFEGVKPQNKLEKCVIRGSGHHRDEKGADSVHAAFAVSEPGRSRGYSTVKEPGDVALPLGVVTVTGPVVAPGGTVADT